jgi:hypothetical protein
MATVPKFPRQEDISEERAIDSFVLGLCLLDFIEEIGRTKLKSVSELMDVANKFTDGENMYHK